MYSSSSRKSKACLNGIKCKVEELPKTISGQRQIGNDKPDFSPIKDTVTETVKVQSNEIKGLLAKQWKAYAQLSTLTLQRLDNIRKSQEKQVEQHE